MNKSQVEIFMLMVREGSIHFVSQRLSIAPSLITTSVCALENELGFNLIKRGRNIRKVILTEKGHAFYRLAPELLRLLNAIADIQPQEILGNFEVDNQSGTVDKGGDKRR